MFRSLLPEGFPVEKSHSTTSNYSIPQRNNSNRSWLVYKNRKSVWLGWLSVLSWAEAECHCCETDQNYAWAHSKFQDAWGKISGSSSWRKKEKRHFTSIWSYEMRIEGGTVQLGRHKNVLLNESDSPFSSERPFPWSDKNKTRPEAIWTGITLERHWKLITETALLRLEDIGKTARQNWDCYVACRRRGLDPLVIGEPQLKLDRRSQSRCWHNMESIWSQSCTVSTWH